MHKLCNWLIVALLLMMMLIMIMASQTEMPVTIWWINGSCCDTGYIVSRYSDFVVCWWNNAKYLQ